MAFGLLMEGISFPENTISIALNGGIGFGTVQSLECPRTILLIDINADEVAMEFLGYHRRCAAAEKGIQHQIAGVRAS